MGPNDIPADEARAALSRWCVAYGLHVAVVRIIATGGKP